MPSFVYKLNSFFSHPPKKEFKKFYFQNKHFQIKYTLILVVLTALGLSLALLPVYYFFYQNYEAFSNLAYGDSIRLLDYIEREKKWIHILFFSVFIGFLIFVSILGFRITSQIVRPIQTLYSHLESLAKEKWSKPEILIDEKEEFYAFIETYNFFLSSYQEMLKRDLKNLKSLKISPKDSKSLFLLQKMIHEKESKLIKKSKKNEKNSIALNALDDEQFDDLHHAS